MSKTELIFTRIGVIALGIGLPSLVVGHFCMSTVFSLIGASLVIPVLISLFFISLISLWKGF